MLHISVQPNYTPSGAKSGWRATIGNVAKTSKTMKGASSAATKALQAHFASGGTSAEYVVYNSDGQKSLTRTYSLRGGELKYTDVEHKGTTAPKKARRKKASSSTASATATAPTKKKAAAKKGSKKGSKKEGSKKKLPAALVARNAYIAKKRAAGMSYQDAAAAWAKENGKPAPKKPGRKAKKGAAKKSTAKKGAAKKSTAKKGAAKKSTAKKGAAKKGTSVKSSPLPPL